MTATCTALAVQFLNAGGAILSADSAEYPAHMSERTGYPRLFALGDVGALGNKGIGLCGARDASPIGLAMGRNVGEIAARLEATLVSGYAKGVDTAGHIGAIAGGGMTVAVLAEGLEKFRLLPEYEMLIDPLEQMTVVSQFPLDARWTVINAMERNKLICGLSQVLVAIEPGPKGGTQNAAQEALRQGVTVIVVAPQDDVPPAHISRLTKRGALLIRTEEALGIAIGEALSSLNAPESSGQGTLFD